VQDGRRELDYLSLTLFVLWILANDMNNAFAPDDLAVVADLLD